MTTDNNKFIDDDHNEQNEQSVNNNGLHTELSSNAKGEDPDAEAYLKHLLNDGCQEGDSQSAMEMPPYYDEQLFKKGQNYMKKYRFVIQSGMLAGLIAVLAIPSILKVLICTRQSSTNINAYKRYVRTIMHTISWYKYPATSKSSKFWISLRAVRYAHAKSSRLSAKQCAGQITQKDLALTQFGFIGFLMLGAFRIQLYDNEFLEATSHMWRVLGYLLGIKDEYNICGENWPITKLRLDIVRRQVYKPALENTTTEFEQMSKILINGLWAYNTALTYGSYMYFTKRLAWVKGYEYYHFDCEPGTTLDPTQRRYYKDLKWWDRIIVGYGLFVVTYLHKYTIIRWYLNFRVLLGEQISYYLPYMAILVYGIKKGYVRIFTKNETTEDFQHHSKFD